MAIDLPAASGTDVLAPNAATDFLNLSPYSVALLPVADGTVAVITRLKQVSLLHHPGHDPAALQPMYDAVAASQKGLPEDERQISYVVGLTPGHVQHVLHVAQQKGDLATVHLGALQALGLAPKSEIQLTPPPAATPPKPRFPGMGFVRRVLG
jgi:hypothetical protein